jgi:hypothetical protein
MGSDFVVANLVHPDFRDLERLRAFPPKLAERHPGCIVASAGVGLPVYELERAALGAGLRVAAFRADPWPPATSGPRRPELEDEEPRADRPTRYTVVVHLLDPGMEGILDRLAVDEPRGVGATVGHRAAELLALMRAKDRGDEVVVFTQREGWPPFESMEGAHVFGLEKDAGPRARSEAPAPVEEPTVRKISDGQMRNLQRLLTALDGKIAVEGTEGGMLTRAGLAEKIKADAGVGSMKDLSSAQAREVIDGLKKAAGE